MNRLCPIENCPNTRPSKGSRPNGEPKLRKYCRKHSKEKKAITWYKQPMPVIEPFVTLSLSSMQFNFFFILCMWGLGNLFFWGIHIIELFIK